jgi:hypothetical protein
MTDFPDRRRSGAVFAPERRLVDPPPPPDTGTTQADRQWRAKAPNASPHPYGYGHHQHASAVITHTTEASPHTRARPLRQS